MRAKVVGKKVIARRTTRPKWSYRLLYVCGGTEPQLLGETCRGWDALEKEILAALKSGGYDESADGLFYLRFGARRRSLGVGSFTAEYMDELRERAKKEPLR